MQIYILFPKCFRLVYEMILVDDKYNKKATFASDAIVLSSNSLSPFFIYDVKI